MNTILTSAGNKTFAGNRTLEAIGYYSGFDLAHDTYNAISCASDGRIYYILSSAVHNEGGRMYAFDPVTNAISLLGNLNEICNEKNKNVIAQGKSHVSFYESNGKLYFSTHIGYYENIRGMDRMPVNLPDGYGPYPGGHILSYDLYTGKFEDLALTPSEGILSMTMDTERGQIYGITWPKGNFIQYDVQHKKLTYHGVVSPGGDESGEPGDDYRVLCRSLFVDPRDGKVYFSTAEGDIRVYDPAKRVIDNLDGIDLRLDYFGTYDPKHPGSMAYNWRKIFWYGPEQVAYGVHGNSGYLFRFDPRKRSVQIVERITSQASKSSGMFDQFSYGYLGFDLAPDNETIFYLTGGPIYVDGRRLAGKEVLNGAAKGLENLHLVTYNIPRKTYKDHGAIYFEDKSRPTYVNSIAVDAAGNIYTIARFEHAGKLIHDLVKIKF